MMNNQALSLMEILAIIIVVGILAAIALPNFAPMRESVLDKESNASLKLIQAAQKIYNMENTFYYPCVTCASPGDTAGINTNLRLSLPTVGQNWTYAAKGGTTTGCGQATSTGNINTPTGRTWRLSTNDSDGDPDSGTCP
jgi:type II secretory pathway pseudopilin PulG